MGELLIRRREMIQPSSTPVITPAYELASPTSTENYQISWAPLSTYKDFTILCEAYCSNRNWGSSAKSVFAISSGASFRAGAATNYNYYESNVKTSTGSPYLAIIFNKATSVGGQDEDPYKCMSLFTRDSSATKTLKRFACRFDYANLKIQGFSTRDAGRYAPNNYWWNVSLYPYFENGLYLNYNTGTTCQINIFRGYECMLTDDQINDFLNGVT